MKVCIEEKNIKYCLKIKNSYLKTQTFVFVFLSFLSSTCDYTNTRIRNIEGF